MALSREEIARRYGTAIFDFAKDQGKTELMFKELTELKKAVQAEPRFVQVLSNPVINSHEKKELLTAVEQGFSAELQEVLNFLLSYDRFGNLLDIIDEFTDLYNKVNHIGTGIAKTAVKLDKDQLQRLADSYAKKYGLQELHLENEVDPEIIGGVVLKVQGRVIDGSVKHRLEKIRAVLTK
ncbi:ATP synthase F1 subunit delta [Lactobacillus sp.]|uniref:ATP synthase F1 subunit delta n=1 Tax=Lactobacillus sp. TaxID=1591 RepID=UPI003EF19581